ncbi:MAG: hypothetical protein U5R30_04320 [Deltaproteobacteria bacterium]|nr:hypothetical protein [Deltaproteobacteria bacterium]
MEKLILAILAESLAVKGAFRKGKPGQKRNRRPTPGQMPGLRPQGAHFSEMAAVQPTPSI